MTTDNEPDQTGVTEAERTAGVELMKSEAALNNSQARVNHAIADEMEERLRQARAAAPVES